jgi:asparagine synthase (glutamine-hydrolysing)
MEAGEAMYPFLRRRRFVGAALAAFLESRSLSHASPDGLRRALSYEGIVSSERSRSALYAGELTAVWHASRHKERVFSEILRRAWTDDPGDLMQALMIHLWLPGNGLLSLDKVTMAHSLEARVPFFDPELLAFGMRVPSAVRLKRNKHVLREAMRSDLPPFALRRPKKPFGTPLRAWFDHELSGRVQEVLLDRRSLSRGLFQAPALEKLVRRHFRRQTDHTELIFRLTLLELWQQAFLDEVPAAVEPKLEAQR